MEIEKLLKIDSPSPLENLRFQSGQHIWCKRDDLLHNTISGNKWRKLKPLIEKVVQNQYTHIASFGGAYSNHLHALGYVCNQLQIPFTALVRAHPDSPPTPTLKDLVYWGASVHYLSRQEYKKRNETSLIEQLKANLNIDILVPEGGSSSNCLNGVASIIKELEVQDEFGFDLIVLPVASGGTMAGLIKYIEAHKLNTKVLGIAVLKGEGYLENLVRALLHRPMQSDVPQPAGMIDNANTNWEIIHDERFHCGGYAKTNKQILDFKNAFYQQHKIHLDNVYNAKCFYALNQLLKEEKLIRYQRKLVLHTGGLQGDRR